MIGSRPLNDLEIESVLNSFSNTRDSLMFIFGIRTGFRISEILSLKVSDVHQNGKILDTVSVERKNMKGKHSSRRIALHHQLKQFILNHLAQNNFQDNDYLFRSQKGGAISVVQAWRILNTQYKALGLQGKLGTHAMRKSYASRMHEKLGRDILKTQKAMGHANINSTVAYLSFDEEEITRAILEA